MTGLFCVQWMELFSKGSQYVYSNLCAICVFIQSKGNKECRFLCINCTYDVLESHRLYGPVPNQINNVILR